MRATVVFALIASLSSCKNKEGDDAKAPPPAPTKVPLVTAEATPTPDVLTLTGVLVADQRAEVTADTQGKAGKVAILQGLAKGEKVVARSPTRSSTACASSNRGPSCNG